MRQVFFWDSTEAYPKNKAAAAAEFQGYDDEPEGWQECCECGDRFDVEDAHRGMVSVIVAICGKFIEIASFDVFKIARTVNVLRCV